MYKIGFIIGIFLFFSGCSYVNITPTNDEVNASKRVYKNISKDAVLEAAKKMFIASNKNEFVIDSYRDRVEVSKVIFVNDIFSVNLYLDKWKLEVHQFENETRANLSLVRTDAIEQVKNFSVPDDIFRLFWERLDYLLGLKNEWVECTTYQSKRFNFDDTLCNEFISSDKPLESDKVKNIYIAQRKDTGFTIDKSDPLLFKETNEIINTKKYNYIQSEKIEDLKVNQTISSDEIIMVKEQSEETNSDTNESEEVKNDKKSNNSNVVQEKINDEDLKKFTENINNIINNKNNNQ